MESPNWYSEYQTFQQLTNAAGEPFRFSGDLHYAEVYTLGDKPENAAQVGLRILPKEYD